MEVNGEDSALHFHEVIEMPERGGNGPDKGFNLDALLKVINILALIGAGFFAYGKTSTRGEITVGEITDLKSEVKDQSTQIGLLRERMAALEVAVKTSLETIQQDQRSRAATNR